MRWRRLLPILCVSAVVPAQEWMRFRGPGDLLPPQLGGAVNDMADLTVWEFAWAFQRDALTPAAPAEAPLPAALVTAAVGPLRAMCFDRDPEVARMSLWGLARLGREHDEAAVALRAVVLGGLLQRPAPVGEVAVLALGLAARGDKVAIAALRDLAADTAAGRQRAGQAAVPERLRCFALYGLGLAAAGHRAPELQFRVLAAVEQLLLPTAEVPPQVRVAALHALLLVQLDAAPKLPAPALILLDHQWSLEEPAGAMSVRAQVPLAAAAMLRPEDPAAAVWRERFVEALQAPTLRPAVSRSCAQALGRLCRPADEGPCEALRTAATAAKDQQTRNLAFFALGMVGGAEHQAWLLQQLAGKGASFLYRPWIALGLGAGCAARGEPASAEVVAALERGVQTPNPGLFPAFAVGLGLGAAKSSAPALTELLRRQAVMGDAAAPLCDALGMCGAGDALPLLEQVSALRRAPQLCAAAMAAMAAIGGAGQATLRTLVLDDTAAVDRRTAAALALRGAADAASVEAMAKLLADGNQPAERRSFAALALGSLCDRSPRHWSARLAAGIDYRSATPVLVGQPGGVLRLP